MACRAKTIILWLINDPIYNRILMDIIRFLIQKLFCINNLGMIAVLPNLIFLLSF